MTSNIRFVVLVLVLEPEFVLASDVRGYEVSDVRLAICSNASNTIMHSTSKSRITSPHLTKASLYDLQSTTNRGYTTKLSSSWYVKQEGVIYAARSPTKPLPLYTSCQPKAQALFPYLCHIGLPLTCVRAHLYGFQIAFHLQSAYPTFYMSCSYFDSNLCHYFKLKRSS